MGRRGIGGSLEGTPRFLTPASPSTVAIQLLRGDGSILADSARLAVSCPGRAKDGTCPKVHTARWRLGGVARGRRG
jgi:hypothetical protein